MDEKTFRLPLHLPAQGAAETEATLLKWHVSEGDRFQKDQILAEAESAKAVFDFLAPCSGCVVKLLHKDGQKAAFDQPVMEVETADPAMRDWIPPAAAGAQAALQEATPPRGPSLPHESAEGVVVLGIGGYLPQRVVTNAELLKGFPDIAEGYIYQITGIRERRWAAEGEKPSDMACAASLEAIRKAGISARDLDAIVLSTTTPDVAMPATACILQDRLGLGGIPAFDLNAACSGWLYAVAMARGMIFSGMARTVLTVGVDVQSRLLDKSDRDTYFLFGDGAGAAVIAAGKSGHRIRQALLSADAKGLHLARREDPGYMINGRDQADPWIRLDGHALFRFATESFAAIIREVIEKTGWQADETRWVIPHQANGRILKAAAKRSGVAFDRFLLNLERVGNTSSASIPLALLEIEDSLKPGDKLVLCSVGAGVTTAAISVEW